MVVTIMVVVVSHPVEESIVNKFPVSRGDSPPLSWERGLQTPLRPVAGVALPRVAPVNFLYITFLFL